MVQLKWYLKIEVFSIPQNLYRTLVANYIIKTIKLTAIILGSLLFIRAFFVEPGRVNGRSMEPTFFDKQYFIVNKISTLIRSPRRLEIVQCIEPSKHTLVIKKIIGLPGEHIAISGSQIFVNNTPLEPGLIASDEPLTQTYTDYGIVPEHSYFILGDNPSDSIDSRSYGAIHRKYILGVAKKL